MGGEYSMTLDLCSRTFQNRVIQIFLSSERICLSSTNRYAGLHWEIPKNADGTRFSKIRLRRFPCTPNGDIHHGGPGQVAGPDHLVREQHPKCG
jgi:hypothetical protein